MGRYKQRGMNSLWPDEIKTYRPGENVPEWLTNAARVKFIDGVGNITLDTTETTSGGYEIKDAGVGTLVRLEGRRDYVCQSIEGGKIFPLKLTQLGLLYRIVAE